MSVYKIFPSKDTTIYSRFPTTNAGRDEVLEISSINNISGTGAIAGTDDIRRTLIAFSDEDLANIQTIVTGAFSASLKLYLAYASALPQDYTIKCYPLSQSWVMGTGKLADSQNPKNGTDWLTTDTRTNWSSTTGTQSYLYTAGGGTWNSNYSGSQTFTYVSDKDLNLDITSIANAWISKTIPNYGVILKHTSSIELYATSSIETKFFSVDTHTIYPPCLEFKWDDSTYNTGSLNYGTIATDDFVLLADNNIGNYKENTKYRMRFKTRDRFPSRNFTTSSEYLNWKFLPPQTYWAIQDYKTKEMIIDFDTTYTKLSADTNGNYFTLYTSGLQPERSYKVIVKVLLTGTNEEIVIDNNIIIKVGR